MGRGVSYMPVVLLGYNTLLMQIASTIEFAQNKTNLSSFMGFMGQYVITGL
jgi:hypothetical protein